MHPLRQTHPPSCRPTPCSLHSRRASRPSPDRSRPGPRVRSRRPNCWSTGSAPASFTTRSIHRRPYRAPTRWSASSPRPEPAAVEQFAGAYVVLARSLGLPSRVVVGFTAGRYSGPGEVTVRGADAHAWPQVYLGPRAGWVSFEPTPQEPRGELAPEGVVGPSGVNSTVPTAPANTPTTAPSPSAPFTVPTTRAGLEWVERFHLFEHGCAELGLGAGTRRVDADRRRRRARESASWCCSSAAGVVGLPWVGHPSNSRSSPRLKSGEPYATRGSSVLSGNPWISSSRI